MLSIALLVPVGPTAAAGSGTINGQLASGRSVSLQSVSGHSQPGHPGPTVDARRDQRGRTHFLSGHDGRRVARPKGTARGAAPATVARAHLEAYAAAFGVAHPARDLRAESVEDVGRGRSVVRFQQTSAGLPVLGGQLTTVVDSSGSLLSVSGETSSGVSASAFTLAAATARRTAVVATARARHLRTARLRAATAERWLYDASLFNVSAVSGSRAVWLVTVTARDRLDVRQMVLVDAATGDVVLNVDQVAHLDRVVCDNANRRRDDYACDPAHYARTEGGPDTGVGDVDAAYRATGATAEFFAMLGVDLTALIGSDFGDGRKIRSTVRVCPSSGCPYDNAFWDGSQMVYGKGFAVADDVVAHELTHGVTQNTSGLVYWYQSGAINESLSDVFAELVDQSDGFGNDSTEVRWQLGEDLPSQLGGVTRSMSDPGAFDQPDRVHGDHWVSSQDGDSGGVHTNSGPGNKAAYLIVDGTAGEPGGAFNGLAFPGLGVTKAAHIYWATEQLLTPGSDYADLADALYSSCTTLAASGTAGITTVDCDGTVRPATNATQMQSSAGPSEPQDVKIYGGDRQIRVTWSPPATSGTAPVNSYVLIVNPPIHGENFLPIEDVGLTDVVIGGIPARRSFTFSLTAVSPDGFSPPVERVLAGTSVTMSAPASVRRGRHAVFRGRLRATADGSALGGRTVRLYRRHKGTAYHLVSTRKTGSTGDYTFRPAPRRNARYYVTFVSGTTTLLGARSQSQRVLIRPRGHRPSPQRQAARAGRQVVRVG